MHEHIVIQDREELYYLLSEAAEFEHAVMCSYLYAMWSLKSDTSEDVTAEELAAIGRWRSSIRQVALEEMLHLTLVNNMLAAVGASPHLWRPEFPVPSGRFPAGVVFKLSRFCEATIDHFAFIERPEEIPMVDGAGFDHPEHYQRVTRPGLLSPMAQDYVSQGQLYHSVVNGLADLVEELGEENVFVGHGEAQVSSAEFGLPGLFKIDGLEAARRAVEEIVTQGEGAPAHREDSHYQRFIAIKRELEQLKLARPGFEPARPVVENPILTDPCGKTGVTSIEDTLTSKVVDIGDSLYGLMMRTFAQVFAPAPLPTGLRTGLALAATDLMYAMSLVGEAVTRLPVGPGQPGQTAGLTFALPLSSGQLVQSSAAQILNERVQEILDAVTGLESLVSVPGLVDRLQQVSDRFIELHEQFEGNLATAVNAVAQVRPATKAKPAPAESSEDLGVAHTDDITIRFDTRRCIHSRHCVLGAPRVFLANVDGPWLHPEEETVEKCVEIAHACPSGAITYERHDGGLPEAPPQVNVLQVRENGPYAIHAEISLKGHESGFRATLCRCGKSANKPYCDNSHRKAGFIASGEPDTIKSDPLPSRDGPLHIEPIVNGPLQVMGNLEICSGTNRTVWHTDVVRLCRCGGSSNKPFCDGTHARIGFISENPKD